MSYSSKKTFGNITYGGVFKETTTLNTNTVGITNALSSSRNILECEETTSTGLRFCPSYELCNVFYNYLLAPWIFNMGDILNEDYKTTLEELKIIESNEGNKSYNYFAVEKEVNFLYEATQDLKERDPHKLSRSLFAYGEKTVVNVLYERGINLPYQWEADEFQIFVSQEVPKAVKRSSELRALKEVFISLDILCRDGQINGAMCDMIQYIIFPMFKSRIEVELWKLCSFYSEFRQKQIIYSEVLQHLEMNEKEDLDEEEIFTQELYNSNYDQEYDYDFPSPEGKDNLYW